MLLRCLLNIFCFYYVHTISVLYCAHLWMKCFLGISNFQMRSLFFPVVLFSSVSLHWSLRKALLFFLAILWNSAFRWVYLFFFFSPCLLLLFFLQLFVRPPQTTILPFCISFSWGWSWSPSPIQSHMPPSIVFQALSLSDLTLESVCHFYCIIVRDLN